MTKYKALLFFICLPLWLAAQRAVPPLWGHRVHDEAHVLSQNTIDQLESSLQAYEDSTSNQIVVLIIPSLEGEVLEEYALRAAEENKIGKKGTDNGVLLLIVTDDRKVRIEVGYGLEGVLPDAICNRIIRSEIAPSFRAHNYDEGVRKAIDAIVKAIGGEYVNEEISRSGALEIAELSLQEKILIGGFIFGILGIFTLLALFINGCMGWFLYAFLIPFYAVFPMAVLGVDGGLSLLGAYVIGFPFAKIILSNTPLGKRMAKSLGSGGSAGRGSSRGLGAVTTRSSSARSSSSGWSSGSRGFSGGGGRFGGGGSSGSW